MNAMKRLKRPRFLLVYPLVIGLFAMARTSELQLRIAIPFVMLGMALRLWANGYTGHQRVNRSSGEGSGKAGRLITAGPYAYVRHPLYLGSFLIGSGFFIIVGSWWLGLAGLAALFWAYRSKVSEEENVLASECPLQYGAYRESVPAFLSAWRRYGQRFGRWSWAGIRAGGEIKTVIWVIVLLVAVYFREEMFQEHEWLFDERPLYRYSLLVLCVGLMIADGVLDLRRRRMKKVQEHKMALQHG